MRKIKINTDFTVQKVGKNLAIFDAEKSKLYTFNVTAGFIFTGIQMGWTKEKIITRLSEKYNKKPAELEGDVDEVLEDMRRKKIIS